MNSNRFINSLEILKLQEIVSKMKRSRILKGYYSSLSHRTVHQYFIPVQQTSRWDVQRTLMKQRKPKQYTSNIWFIIQLMGQCTNGRSSKSEKRFGDEIPAGTNELPKEGTPSNEYSLHISNIKLQNIQYQNVSGRIVVGNNFDTELPKLRKSKTVTWPNQYQISLSLTDYELRTNFLKIYVTGDEKYVGYLNLNLYLISTGPYHHRFKIRFDNDYIGIISLDVRMSRIVELRMVTEKVTVRLLKEHPEEAFHFSLKTFTSQDRQIETESSYNSEVIHFNDKPAEVSQMKELRSPTPKISPKNNFGEQMVIKWRVEEALHHNRQCLPSLQHRCLTSQIHNECFQFLLWKLQKIGEAEDGEHEFEADLYAECFISFNKLFFIEEKDCSSSSECERVVDIVQNIYHRGKIQGDLRMLVKIQTPPLSHQMTACVRTQNGIQLITYPFSKNSSKENIAGCSQIRQIFQIRKNLQNTLREINEYNGRKSDYAFYVLRRSICVALNKLIPILKIKGKHGIYNYANENDFIQGQSILVDVGLHLLSYLEQQDTNILDSCWRTLVELIDRGEFDLPYMAFNFEQRQKIKKGDYSKNNQPKLNVQLKYQSFLYTALNYVIRLMNKKALVDNEKSFYGLFYAYAYFRIPQFREVFLELLCSQNLQLSSPNEKFQMSHLNGNLMILFDWQSNFFGILKQIPGSEQNFSFLNQTLKNKQFLDQISRNGIPLFSFLMNWIKYIEKIAQFNKNIVWQSLPGYQKLTNALLSAMKIRKITQYPDTLKQLTIRMLANQNLINIFLHILFDKANLYNFYELVTVIELVDYYFEEFRFQNKKLPSTFAYQYFFEAVKLVLESEQSYPIAKLLLVIYRSYSMFSISFTKTLSMYLLGKIFFKLFLHWAQNIRFVFQHILVYRIDLQTNILSKDDFKNEVNEQIRVRYKKLIAILKAAKEVKEVERTDKLAFLFQKDFHKNMRNKLKIKMKLKKGKKVNIYGLDQLSPDLKPRATTQIAIPQQNESDNIQKNNSCKVQIQNTKRKLSFFELDSEPELKLKRSNSIRKPIAPETDFDVPEIEIKLLSYLQRALRELNNVQKDFDSVRGLGLDPEKIPQIQVKPPMDEGDIRPNNIDQ